VFSFRVYVPSLLSRVVLCMGPRVFMGGVILPYGGGEIRVEKVLMVLVVLVVLGGRY
jgi:hypothetical protein